MTQLESTPPTEEGIYARAFSVFHPHAMRRHFAAIANENLRFVHYTSAAAAIGILQSNSVWLRNVTCMNDFMEVEHGLECLAEAYNGPHGDKLKSALDGIHPAFCEEIEALFNGWSPTFAKQTFVFCMSEHDASHEENFFGRLSMWRAYGSQTRIALVLKKDPFLAPSDALNAYTSPVEYFTKSAFNLEFGAVVEGIEQNLDFLKTFDRDALKAQVFEMFKYAALCTKHRGFVEEREWRVIYSHDLEPSKRLERDIQIINGTPQPIYKVPLRDVPDEGLNGIEIPKVLDRLIIGPTEYPEMSREAFVEMLAQAGVKDPASRVFVSDIPLR